MKVLTLLILLLLALPARGYCSELLIGYPLVPKKPIVDEVPSLEQQAALVDYEAKKLRQRSIEAEARKWKVSGSWERIVPEPGKGLKYQAKDKVLWEFVWMPANRVVDWKMLETPGGISLVVPDAKQWLEENGYKKLGGSL